MKKLFRYMILTAIAALTFSLGLIAAGCGGKVTLSFDAGEGSPVQSIEAAAGESVELPLSLREGYALLGWSTQKEGGAVLTGSLPVPAENTTYYAVWAEGYRVSFEAAGGVFAEGEPDPLTLAAGTNLFEAVKNISPTKSGLLFGAWFLEDTEITSGTKMPAENITVTAKYKVEYAIETYLLNPAGNSYVRGGEISYASGYVGETVSPDAPMVNGFSLNAAPAGESPVTTVLLDADASRNIFRFYYDRRTYQVLFDANAAGATGSMDALDCLYEGTVTLPQNSFSCRGYRFAGWSSYSNGDVDYVPGSPLAVMGDTVLYAVWDRGYTDRYGGADLIFFPRLEPETAILLRGNVEFEGTRNGDSFSLTTPAGSLLEGKIYGSTYSYRRDDLTGSYTFMEFTDGEAFTPAYDQNRVLTVDSFLNGTYRNGTHTCSGEVLYSDETGDYIFMSGDETFRFLPMRSDLYDYPAVFLVGGEEVGAYIDFVLVDPTTGMGYLGNNMMLILDGYGSAMLGDLSTYLTYDGSYYIEGVYMMGAAELYQIVCFIRDPEGLLTGQEGAVVTNYVYTVPFESGEYNGYVQADNFRGEYSDEAGNTLVLDGFGIFADSFVYTFNGVSYHGVYETETDLLSGSVVSLTAESGETFSFGLDLAQMKFSERKTFGKGSYTEYRFMDGASLQPPFLILYESDATDGDKVLGKAAEIYLPSEDGSTLIKAGSGYCTAEPIGRNSRFSRYTFIRTDVTAGYESDVPEQFVFFNTLVTSATDYTSYNAYCLLEETVNGETTSYLDRYSVTDGGEIWVCSSVSTGGLGALYIDEDGRVTEGQFSIGSNEHFQDLIGTFLYATEQGDIINLYFDILANDDGTIRAVPRAGVEQMLYVVQPTGVEAGGVGIQMIFLDGVSRMKYTADQAVSFLEGSYEPVDTTRFGETVYAFRVGASERFRFVIYSLSEYDDVPLAIKYDSALEQELGKPVDEAVFTDATGGKLILDGYHSATLELNGQTLAGNYIRDEVMQTVTFTALGGAQYMLSLDFAESSFVRLDWATGRSWQLLDNNYEPINGYFAVFEDNITQKIVRIQTSAGSTVSEGRYVVLDSVNQTWGHEEYLLREVSLGTGYPKSNYRVTFAINSEGVGACLVFNPEASGVFTDEEWNVLVLDGFGAGAYYTDSLTGNGTYSVIDFERNFISFSVDDGLAAGTLFYFRLEDQVFHATDYEALAGVYLAENFETVSFGTDGTAYLGNRSGPYFVQNGKAYVYISDTPTEVNAPGGDIYSYNGKTYRRWDGQTLRLNGTVFMRDKDGNSVAAHPDLPATLTFTPNGTTNRNLAAVFTFHGYEEAYTGYTLSLYASGDSLMGETDGNFSPTVRYGNSSYPISFFYTGGTYTFAVTAGYNSLEYLDHNARYYPDTSEVSVPRGGRLYKTGFGFGALQFEKTTISGDFLYLYKKDDPTYSAPIHFEGVPEEEVKIVGYVPGYGNRLEIAFEASDGKNYLLNYYEYYQGGVYFWCYGLFSYQDVETQEYTVRVKTLLYTKMSIAPGYFDAQNGSGKGLGKISAVTLFDKETKAPIVAYDTGITPNGYNGGVWLVDKADVVEHGSTGTCTWGTGYLVTFTFAPDGSVSAANVEKYRFAQVVNYMQHLVNLFFDEEGNVTLASVLVYNGEFGRYEFVSDPHDLVENEDGTFSFRATWNNEESLYTVKVEQDENVTFTDSEGNNVSKPGYTVTVTVG